METETTDNTQGIMIKSMIRHIAYMAILFSQGVLFIAIACLAENWRGQLVISIMALFPFTLSWLAWRMAKRIAEGLDSMMEYPIAELKFIVHEHKYHGESKGKGNIEEQVEGKTSVETETDREDESENYCAHPI